MDATCPTSCVPKDCIHKVARRAKTTGEIFHSLMGAIDTSEKHETTRLAMVQKFWDEMKATDLPKCRSCRDQASMNVEKQDPLAWESPVAVPDMQMTCVEYHQGVGHGPYESAEQASPPRPAPRRQPGQQQTPSARWQCAALAATTPYSGADGGRHRARISGTRARRPMASVLCR